MKKGIAVFLSVLLMLSLAACGSADQNDTLVWYLGGTNSTLSEEKKPEDLFAGVQDTINPAQIYSSLTYTEEMLYGCYTVNDLEKDVKAVRKDIPFEDVTFDNGSFSVSTLPVSVCFGAAYVCNPLTNYNYSTLETVTNVQVAALSFATADDIGHVPCTYEVNGNQIVFREIQGEENIQDGTVNADTLGATFQFTFSLSGPYLTLSRGDATLELCAYAFTENVDSELELSAYSLPDSALVANLDYFQCSDIWNFAIKRNNEYFSRSAYKITDTGLFTIYLEDGYASEPSEPIVQQFAYIAQSDASAFGSDIRLILLDGNKQYFYTDSLVGREKRELQEYGGEIGEMSDEEIEAIAEKRSDLFDDLAEAFREQGIAVTINRGTGEIAMDASVLFSGDSAAITEEGKALLNQFLNAYTSIIFNEEYDGFIEKTLVEGHTAPLANSTYESGLPLSTERANAVKAYCLSQDFGANTERLAASLEAVGLSNSKPVYNADGEVDTEACRRVSFRFIVQA